MTKSFAAFASVCAAYLLAGPVLAADLPVKAPLRAVAPVAYNWSGFYIGGHIGYLWGHTRIDESESGRLVELGATNGAVGGVLGGLNWQSGPLVLGIDADLGWSNAHGIGEVASEFSYDIKWTSHVRGRAGYAAGPWLVFAAGGLAIADLNIHELAVSTSTTRIGGKYSGWSIGGGIDHAFTPNLVGRLEYLRDDFGHKNYSAFDGDSYRASLTGHTLRAALMWRFDGTMR